jgi:ferric-dicitrate binding protein FerR (iron transport regulator)
MAFYDQKYIENPLFVEWVFRPNPGIDKYWNDYLLKHPEEESLVMELKSRLIELKYTEENLTSEEKIEIAEYVIARVERHEESAKRRSLMLSLLKYAAVALIFAVIGGLAVYLKSDKQSIYQQMAGQIVRIPSEGKGPVLITSSGENLNLRRTNSSVDYTQNGTVVLNNDSVLKTSNQDEVSMNQLVIPYGNQSKLTLSDNTVVWLNAGSRLVYPTVFKGKTREVLLFGEAYFEVAKNANQPFIVKTSDIEVKVLGTQFNISAYAEDKAIQTVLKEGSVEIRENDANLFSSKVILKPNQMASFSKTTNETSLYNVDASYYTLWTKGLLSFDDVDFDKVIKKIERFYNISVDFSEPGLRAIRISGKLDLKGNRSEVLEYLQKVSSTEIKRLNENQFIVNK